MKGRIIVTGGDAKRRRELLKPLEDGGYSPLICDALSEFLANVESTPPVALLLLYPDPNEVVPAIFAECAALIAETITVLLSASRLDNERARSKAYKADEFLIEPISPAELIATIDLSLNEATGIKRRGILKVGDLALDRESLAVTLRGQPLPLEPVHARLLEFLMRGIGRGFSRREMVDGVWGPEAAVDERTVDVVVGRIRNAMKHKVAVDPIIAIRSVGYAFNDQFGEINSLPKKQRLSPAGGTFTRKKR